MIKFDNKSKLNQNNNSINITYPRNVNIIFGHYPYPEIINYFIIKIKKNINPNMSYLTNVKGGMTDWEQFKTDKNFINFRNYLINKYQISHPEMFQYFLEKHTIRQVWGNEMKPGDSLDYHVHDMFHGILYLTEGCDLILPELNISIVPKPGDYYIFPPQIYHGFNKYEGKLNRYSLIFNIEPKSDHFKFRNKLST